MVAAGEHDAVRDAVAFLAARNGDGGGPFVALVEALLAAETDAVAEVERHLARADGVAARSPACSGRAARPGPVPGGGDER